jgi:hypothetical protein
MPNNLRDFKSPWLAALLGFLFGGFGLMYVSITQGIVSLLILFVISIITGGAGAIFIWCGSAIWAYLAAINYNERQQQFAKEDLEREQALGARPATPGKFTATTAQGAADPAYKRHASFCTECGAAIREGTNFCGACGLQIGGA